MSGEFPVEDGIDITEDGKRPRPGKPMDNTPLLPVGHIPDLLVGILFF